MRGRFRGVRFGGPPRLFGHLERGIRECVYLFPVLMPKISRSGRLALTALALLTAAFLASGMLRGSAQAQTAPCGSSGYSGYNGGGNAARPTAAFTATPERVAPGGTVTFDGSGSRAASGRKVATWGWDLDGDGRYETIRNTPQASRSYSTLGKVKVSLAVADDCGVVSPVVSKEIEVTSAAAGPDTKAPVIALRAPRRARARGALRRGLKLRVACDENCRLTARLNVSKSVRRKLRRKVKKLGQNSIDLSGGVVSNLRVRPKLPRKARRRIRRVKSGKIFVRVRARDAANNRATARRTVRLTR